MEPRTIWETPLTDDDVHDYSFLTGAEILGVQLHTATDSARLWMKVDPNAGYTTRRIFSRATSDLLGDVNSLTPYLGTVQFSTGERHYFDGGEV